jgi:hypothetical protein
MRCRCGPGVVWWAGSLRRLDLGAVDDELELGVNPDDDPPVRGQEHVAVCCLGDEEPVELVGGDASVRADDVDEMGF